jgi:nitroreductase
MDTMDVILSRRSIRNYTDATVSEEIVDGLLKAGMSAPSAHNQQPWHFVVVDEHGLLDRIPEFHPYSDMLRQAPLAIIVCGDQASDRGEGFWIQDCAAATQNILLAAHAGGLGAVWLGVYPVERLVRGIRELLKLPEDIVPLSIISIGYPAEEKPPANRYRQSRIHHNQW